MAAADPYKVKHVELVLKSSDVLARIFTLAQGDTIPWHYHQHCADHFFVLEGRRQARSGLRSALVAAMELGVGSGTCRLFDRIAAD